MRKTASENILVVAGTHKHAAPFQNPILYLFEVAIANKTTKELLLKFLKDINEPIFYITVHKPGLRLVLGQLV